MKKPLFLCASIVSALLLCACSTPWVTNTGRNAIEQYLIATTIERGINNLNFMKYSGKKFFMDYEYLAPQVDKPYLQGNIELQLSKAGIIITKKAAEADYILQPLCGVLATDYDKFFIGTPALPIPMPYTDISFAIPEIPIFSKYSRMAYGRFTFTVFEAKTRKPLESFECIKSSSKFNNWIVFLIPFKTHDLDMTDTKSGETSFSFMP